MKETKTKKRYFVEDLNRKYYSRKEDIFVSLPNDKVCTDYGINFRFNFSVESFVNFLGVKRNNKDKDRTGRQWSYVDFLNTVETAKDDIGDMQMGKKFAIQAESMVIIAALQHCANEKDTYIIEIVNVLAFADNRKIHIGQDDVIKVS